VTGDARPNAKNSARMDVKSRARELTQRLMRLSWCIVFDLGSYGDDSQTE
jgi:hypothetical protein